MMFRSLDQIRSGMEMDGARAGLSTTRRGGIMNSLLRALRKRGAREHVSLSRIYWTQVQRRVALRSDEKYNWPKVQLSPPLPSSQLFTWLRFPFEAQAATLS